MKQNEACELLKKLQENKYVDSKMLKKILTFSDEVLEKLNSIDDDYLGDTCKILLLYNNEKERLEIIQLIMQLKIKDIWIKSHFAINFLYILKNKMLRDNKVAIKHAQLFVRYSNGDNEDILYKFLTDEFFTRNNLVTKFVNKISNIYIYNDDYKYILNVIKEKYNDKYIDTYIKLFDEQDMFIVSNAYNFIMNNTFGNPKDNIFMVKIIPLLGMHYRKEVIDIIVNNKDLFVAVIKENEQFFRLETTDKKEFAYKFFEIASNDKYTKDEVNKGIKLISKYYYNCFEEENLLNVLKNKKFKEIDEIVNLGVVNSGRDVISLANLDSEIYKKVIYILKNYSDYINVTLKCVREMDEEYLEELEYVINSILKYAKQRKPKDFYNIIDITKNSHLVYNNLNIEYSELYINENNELKRNIYYKIMTENKYIEYKEELINIIKPINNYYLLQILKKYIATINDEKELLELFKMLVKYNKNEDLNKEESYIVATLTGSIIEEYDNYVLDEDAKDIRNYILNGLMGLNNEEFLKENYDVIYNCLYEAMMLKKYENFNEVKKVIKAKFNITIETEKEAHENKIELVNDLINSMENKEEVNIRKLAKKNK